ncbi:hypothetical protein ACFWRG_02480 [Micromonospora tulbaghiae]|uniref:Uncharacterized protein n=1 Tax=Micromonospora tulbaghiae TaxID=479978 RepID=A0ABY0KFG8_9ACTN|nr:MULTISPECIES: hypothetical protein [Micromonospora]MDX5460302.1 hypothetical protein [Micromonospora tulbaghiae]SCE65847.1 hypothetical protein GA0070562_1401 [Micromonospora tulbaghiae]
MSERLKELLLTELRRAVDVRIEGSDDPDEITAELVGRLRRIKAMRRQCEHRYGGGGER